MPVLKRKKIWLLQKAKIINVHREVNITYIHSITLGEVRRGRNSPKDLFWYLKGCQ